jgi:formate C-acetyltransferase
MDALKAEMREFYSKIRRGDIIAKNEKFNKLNFAIRFAMDKFYDENPGVHPYLLKAALYEEIEKQFEPVIFKNSPFFFEMGVRAAESWGTPDGNSAASWMFNKKNHIMQELESKNTSWFQMYNEKAPLKIWSLHCGGFDFDHHCLGYTRLMKEGLKGIMSQISERMKTAEEHSQKCFLEGALRGCNSMIRAAAKFADKAEELLINEKDPAARKNLSRMAKCARRIPENPPESFYEGLAMILFMREAAASMEGIGISVFGHIDRLLIDLYRQDIKSGVMTEKEAKVMLGQWMVHTDVKFHIEDNQWPETSTCMELGGCDADGNEVYNELTKLILTAHKDYKLLNPKPNCRISSQSSQEYLELLSSLTLAGHNNLAIINDDVLIPACVKMGKDIRDARLYVNGGCQETMCEGVEHTAGAYFYYNIARVLDLSLRPLDSEQLKNLPPHLLKCLPEKAAVKSFQEFYDSLISSIEKMALLGSQWAAETGSHAWEVQPSPMFSSTLKGCIENAVDYAAGGAKYNPSGIAYVGFGTLVDSLAAIKSAVYDLKITDMETLLNALSCNWNGYESLKAKFISMPKYGWNDAESNEMAARVSAELTRITGKMKNERNDKFQASFFVYYAFKNYGKLVRATPDGRAEGDMLSQGASPGRVRPPQTLTDVFNSMSHIDFTGFPGNAVFDIQIPAGRMAPDKLSSVLKTFTRLKGPTFQPNCASIQTMKDAQINPEEHKDLIVRISGLSAVFVALTKEVQDEIITRNVFAM